MENSHAVAESRRVPRRGSCSGAVRWEDAGGGLEHLVKTTRFLAVPEAFDQLNALYAECHPVSLPLRAGETV